MILIHLLIKLSLPFILLVYLNTFLYLSDRKSVIKTLNIQGEPWICERCCLIRSTADEWSESKKITCKSKFYSFGMILDFYFYWKWQFPYRFLCLKMKGILEFLNKLKFQFFQEFLFKLWPSLSKNNVIYDYIQQIWYL